MRVRTFIAVITLLLSGAALSDTLNFASPAAPRASMHREVFEPWLEKIIAESEGTLNIRTFYSSPLGNYRNMYDRVTDGVVDMAFTSLAPIGGKFMQTDVASLPFEIETAEEGSIALWRLYEQGVISSEFKDIKLLAIFMFPNSALHTSERQILTMDDFSGIKLRTAGKLQSDTVVLLGASPVTAAAGDIYQGLNRGVFDGAVIPWTGVAPFKLDEVTRFHLNAPLGSSTAMIFMNRDSFEKLPKAAQQAIENNSGLSLTQWAGTHSDTDAQRIRERVGKQDNQTIADIAPAEALRWKARLQPIIDEWVASTPNGESVLAEFRKEIEILRGAGE